MAYRTKNKRTVILLYTEDIVNLLYIGAFVNAHHVAEHIGGYDSNVGKYLKNIIHTLNGYIAIEVEIGSRPVDKLNMVEMGRIAEARKKRARLSHLTNETLLKLSDEKIDEIEKILQTP